MKETLTAKEHKELDASEQSKYEKKGAKYVLKQAEEDEESSEEQSPVVVAAKAVRRVGTHRDLVRNSKK